MNRIHKSSQTTINRVSNKSSIYPIGQSPKINTFKKSPIIPLTLGQILLERWRLMKYKLEHTAVHGNNNYDSHEIIHTPFSPHSFASYETYLINKLINHQDYTKKLNKKFKKNQQQIALIMTKLNNIDSISG